MDIKGWRGSAGQNTERMKKYRKTWKKKRSVTDIIRTRQKNRIGIILRGNSLQRKIMEGSMEG